MITGLLVCYFVFVFVFLPQFEPETDARYVINSLKEKSKNTQCCFIRFILILYVTKKRIANR